MCRFCGKMSMRSSLRRLFSVPTQAWHKLQRYRLSCEDTSITLVWRMLKLCPNLRAGHSAKRPHLRRTPTISPPQWRIYQLPPRTLFHPCVSKCRLNLTETDLSPIIDIRIPSPSLKRTTRETNFLSRSLLKAKLSISRASHSRVLATHHCGRIRGGGRGWLCYFLMKRKNVSCTEN